MSVILLCNRMMMTLPGYVAGRKPKLAVKINIQNDCANCSMRIVLPISSCKEKCVFIISCVMGARTYSFQCVYNGMPCKSTMSVYFLDLGGE